MATRLRLVIPGFDQARALGYPNMAALLRGGEIQVIEEPMGALPDPSACDWYATDLAFPRLNGVPNPGGILEAWAPTIVSLMGTIAGLHMALTRSRKPDFIARFDCFGQVAIKLGNFEQQTAEAYTALDRVLGVVGPERCLLIVPVVAIPVQRPQDYGRANSGGPWYVRIMGDGFSLRRCDLGGVPYYVRGLQVEVSGVTYEKLVAAQEKPAKPAKEAAVLVLRISDKVPRGKSGIYRCGNCGNQITGVAGKEMPPCGQCNEPEIAWTLVQDADAGEPTPEAEA